MSVPREKLLFFTVLFLVLGAIYAPGLGYGLNLDDRTLSDHVGFYGAGRMLGSDLHFRPLKNVLFWIGQKLSPGNDYRLWRIAGLLLFCASSIVVEAFFERLLRSRRAALAATALYALLAVHSSVVLWLSAYHIPVFLIATLCGLLWADRGAETGSARFYALSTAALVVSLLAYEAAVAFPALLALQTWVLRRGHRSRTGHVYLATVAVLVSVYLMSRLTFGARFSVQPDNLAYPPGERWWLTLNAARYVLLHAYYALDPWTTFGVRLPELPAEHAVAAIGAWVVLLAISSFAAVSVLRRRSLVGFGWLFFVFGLAPMCNFVPVGAGPVADYYLLLPSIGLVVALVAAIRSGLARLSRPAGRWLVYGIVVLWVVGNVLAVVRTRVPAWENPLTLEAHSREVQGDSFLHRYLAARIADKVGDYTEAVRLYRSALDDAPYHEPAQVGLVVALINDKQLSAAEAEMARLSPRDEEARQILRVSRAFVLEARGRTAEAADLYRALVNEDSPFGVEARITALVRLTYMSERFGIAMNVPYSLENAPYDVRPFYLFPGYHER
jgi:tetratricopeptide (TPR) repeat protein